MAVSVCIPTYKRQDLLEECVRSVFECSVRPLEIVVSDDAHEPTLAACVAALAPPPGIEIRYVENGFGRRQAANVRNAFEHARYELLVLMHDDDFFVPGGIDALWRAWLDSGDTVDAVFGWQRVVDADGRLLPALNERWNRMHRHLAEPGLTRSNLWAALMQQFPMNGMMLRRSIALAAGVPPEHEVGRHTDLHFGVRYALAAERPFLLIDTTVSAYRQSTGSISRSQGLLELDGHLNYAALEGIEPRDALEHEALRHGLNRAAGNAVLAFLAQGERRRAFEIFARHWSQMRVPMVTWLKLVLLLCGSLVGVRWSAERLQRRRLGLPRLSLRRRAS